MGLGNPAFDGAAFYEIAERRAAEVVAPTGAGRRDAGTEVQLYFILT